MSKREQRIKSIMKIRQNLNSPLTTNPDFTQVTYKKETIVQVMDELKMLLALDGLHPVNSKQKVKVTEIE